jgi:sugar phosphate isomerase/epimerase
MTYRQAMRADQIALQLYTVRRLAADDLAGTLRAVAVAGYRFVEIAGVPEAARGSLSSRLADAGLRAVAAHQGLEGLRSEADDIADWLAGLGCPRVVVPSLPDAERGTVDGVRQLAAELSGFAASLAERGITLGYHNHASEFAPLDGTTAWDVLLTELAPDVEIELDVYWAAVGGRDPVELIRAHRDRVRLLHVKDRAAGAEPRDAPAGEGILDIAAIVAAGDEAGVEWFVAEQDEPQDPLRDIATAYRYLESISAA